MSIVSAEASAGQTALPDITIVLPVYFNQENLRRTFARLKQEVIDVHPELRFELVCVDDGSGDRSVEVLLELQREQPDVVRVITLTRNFGQVSALWCGYRHSRGRYTVSMSADGQDPARLVNEIIDGHIKEGYDVVICAREERDESAYRVLTSRLFYWLVKSLSFSNMPPGGFDLVSMSRRALDVFLQQPETHAFFQGQILWMGFRQKLIPYKREERQGGRSRWTFRKKLTYLIDGVLSYSYAPLRLMSLLGLGCALTGFAYATLIVALRLTGHIPVIGLLTPLMVVVLVLGGMQMLMLGIVGEYLWRTLAQTRNRPLYVIDRVFDARHDRADRSDRSSHPS